MSVQPKVISLTNRKRSLLWGAGQGFEGNSKKENQKKVLMFLSPPLEAGGDYVIGRITFPCVRVSVRTCVSNLGFQGFKVLKS